ncbi:hypothetical protein [Pollutibacter soli]|uniref:hypothetical protein n=1 Tax=Pollutibacter soli TaxID=3034157 RepID=UPI0030135AD9
MRNFLFRFFFIFFLVTISPWAWFPWISDLFSWVDTIDHWIVNLFNKNILHVKNNLNIDGGGSGDYSYAWAQFYTYLILAFTGAIIWTIIDRKRERNYNTLGYFLRTMVRYYVSIVALSYGIIKLFALQMYPPNLSQLATPLGDYLPMRFSWMFFGYSAPYQIFSGAIETFTGLLLLNRKTVTPGALLALATFTNVFMLNLSYDIPVKLYSMQVMIYSLFLVLQDWRRLFHFFFLNRSVRATALYDIELTKTWHRIGRGILKLAFIIVFIIMPFIQSRDRYLNGLEPVAPRPINTGIYDIKVFARNGDTLAVAANKDTDWKDFIFDVNGMGSVNTTDSLFRQRYRRGYFAYQPDTIKHVIDFKKFPTDSVPLFSFNYKIVDSNRLQLWGPVRKDTLFFYLEKNNRHFQLTENQFHWISEANR